MSAPLAGNNPKPGNMRDDETMNEYVARSWREAAIEECAKEIERGYFLSDMIRCADTLDDCAARIRALAISSNKSK